MSISIIPRPMKVTETAGRFTLTPETAILTAGRGKAIGQLARQAAAILRPATGYALPIGQAKNDALTPNTILLSTGSNKKNLGPEGYELTVTAKGIAIRANKPAGVFYALQSLRQLLPPEIEHSTPVKKKWTIPCVKIQDVPRFTWRGMHLDICRHFFGPDDIKRYIDYLARNKCNTFHLHLTEDQGWRIEIKKYPKLQSVAAWRKGTDSHALLPDGTPGPGDDCRYGGFLTQDQVRELVAYAAERFITIVPEIDIPGHCVAAIAAYPELSCSGKAAKVSTQWGIMKNILCAGKEKPYTFMENVLKEVMDLFPSKWIHIGGDEAPKGNWEKCPRCQKRIHDEGLADEAELQSYFTRRIATFLQEHGREVIGWDEILEGGLPKSIDVMAWRKHQYTIDAARAGHTTVAAVNSYGYFNCRQELGAGPGANYIPRPGIGLPLSQTFSFEPTEGIGAKYKKNVIGVQGSIWTEYIPTWPDVEYLLFPRLLAMAEVAWSPKKKVPFNQFTSRAKKHVRRLEIRNVNYRKSFD